MLALLLTPLLRLSGAYFAIANLAAAMAAFQIVSNPDLTEITSGPYGVSLTGVYAPNLAYGVALGVLGFTLALVIWLRNSRFGLALQAIREDAVTAGMAGVNVVRARTIFLAAFRPRRRPRWRRLRLVCLGVLSRDGVSSNFSIFAIVFALFGGVATVTGPILGVLLLYGAYDAIGISAPQYFQLVYGLLIMGLVLFLPEGLVSIFKRRGIDVP